MADFDDEIIDEVDDPAEAVTVVDGQLPAALVDYRGSAPYAVGVDDEAKGTHRMVLLPGLNEVPGHVWSNHAGHPGIAARLPSGPKDDGRPRPLAGTVVLLPGVPRRGDDLFDLIARTWSKEGLAAIESAEVAIYGKKPRATVVAALKEARRLLVKRGLA